MSDIHEHPARPQGYDKHDISVWRTAIISLASIIFMGLVSVWLNEIFVFIQQDIVQEAVLEPTSKDFKTLTLAEERILHSYGIVDSVKQTYRVPIERAMELLAAEAKKK